MITHSKIYIRFKVLNYPRVCLEIRTFLNTYLGRKLPPIPAHSYQLKAIPHPCQKVLWTKDRDHIRPQDRKHYRSSRSRWKFPPSH